ncbi:MAG: nicotinamide mononucleotide transporter [Piscirickettsiaceae bacterium]|jgi:nicotinamide mononucleotide transporter|nr:nicotinamide mononucleotide transporter [Piscirickettsiaceae bacterium]
MIDNSLINAVTDGLLALSAWEVFASLLGIGYVVFAAKESQWCWPLAFVSTLIYTILFWQDQLPMQALLNFYYMAMAIYGYQLWKKQGKTEEVIAISKLTWLQQFAFLITGSLLTFLTAKYLISIDASQSPYLDAGVTVFSVLNTVLMARKVLQNWLYWIVIDVAAIQLYYQTGYYATIAMFSVYLVLAFLGYINWMKRYYKEQKPTL